MKRLDSWFMLVFLAIAGTTTHAQSFQDMAALFQGMSRMSVFLEKAGHLVVPSGRNPLDSLSRSLTGGYVQTYLWLNYAHAQYELLLISRNDEVALASLIEEEGLQRVREKRLFTDKNALADLCRQHNQAHESRWSLSAFTEALMQKTIFGIQCGYSGRPTAEAALMAEDIRQEKSARFRSWLRHPLPEMQAYGALGLLELQSARRIPVSDHDKAIIAGLTARNPLLFTCAGCIYGLIQPFTDAVLRP